jgi:ferredoxin
MSPGWPCPHCQAVFAKPKGEADALECPKCGKSLNTPPPSAAKTPWYYSRNNLIAGPMSTAELKERVAAGTILSTDLLLRAGTARWVLGSKVRGLFSAPAEPARPATLAPAALPAAVAAEAPDLMAPAPCSSWPALAKSIFESRQEVLSEGHVVPNAARCVQCGCCSYNCPIGIDVRSHARRGQPINASHCLTCGECVKRCPRGVLAFERIPLFGK